MDDLWPLFAQYALDLISQKFKKKMGRLNADTFRDLPDTIMGVRVDTNMFDNYIKTILIVEVIRHIKFTVLMR